MVSNLVLDTVICHSSVDVCRGMIAESFGIHSSGNHLCSFDPLDSYTFLIHIANYFWEWSGTLGVSIWLMSVLCSRTIWACYMYGCNQESGSWFLYDCPRCLWAMFIKIQLTSFEGQECHLGLSIWWMMFFRLRVKFTHLSKFIKTGNVRLCKA